jgi:DNA polymerase III alpha subunit (gram-positive type)
MVPIFLDVESTGVEEKDRLVQLAFRYDNEPAQCCLFKPPLPISIEAMSITHITNEDVSDLLSFQEHSLRINLKELLVNEENVLIAHNAPFDIKMLLKELLNTEEIYEISRIVKQNNKMARGGFLVVILELFL